MKRWVVKGEDRYDYPIEKWFDDWAEAMEYYNEQFILGGYVQLWDIESESLKPVF